MAMKHYGGSTPPGPASWVCPSCQAENTVPLKAGCQSCGAGGDARKAEVKSGLSPETQKFVAEALAEEARPTVPVPDVVLAFEAWTGERTTSETNWHLVREAFMAGVAWAQAQKYTMAVAPALAALDTLTEKGFPVVFAPDPVTSPITLLLGEGGHLDALEPQTLMTILAALAFYRDNVLNYNAVEGQLTPEQVTTLVERLLPKESE